ncbi:hypothetical protein ATER59S_01696 [Aquamicrobium terrae]
MSPSVAAAAVVSSTPPPGKQPATPTDKLPSGPPASKPNSEPLSRVAAKLPAKLPSTCLIVFGLDEKGRPHASWFGDEDVALARKAAAMMGMAAVEATSEALRALAGQLPAGRVFASGRAFVPFIKGGLYDQLAAHLPAGAIPAGEAGPRPAEGATAAEAAGATEAADTMPADAPNRAAEGGRGAEAAPSAKTAAGTPGGSAESNGDTAAASKPQPAGLAGWSALKAGDLVLAKDDPDPEGWYDAVVVEVRGDLFTLTWRDWPELGRIVRRAEHIALLHPAYVASRQ